MGWEVKTDMGGQAKHGLWGSNVKTGKYLPTLGCRESISGTFFGLKGTMLGEVN